ncbi:putative G-protein coupled receptor 139 [Tubulanus polymorphus]|uniref:putative G-protein coupled receptor 139 n=1 Tax=Tubulanus polymorphus TaxID=672921 RepID=UPI003DA43501
MAAEANVTREEACAQQYAQWSGRFYINVYILTPIMFAGSLMNTLNVVVFTKLKSSHPSIHLLKCLALADIGLLFGHFLADTLRYLIFYINNGDKVFADPFSIYPKMYAYGTRALRIGFVYERNWLTVLIQIERLLTVLYPLKASQWWTKKHMNRIIGAATVLFFIWPSYFPLTLKIEEYMDPCHGPITQLVHKYPKIYVLCNKLIGPIFRLVIPCGAVLSINTALIVTLYVKFKQRQQLGGTSQKLLTGDSKATRMVISMSVTFLVLELPATFSKVRSYALPNAVIWELAMDIAYVTSDLNSCVNFILYCIVNKQFYQTLRQITCKTGSLEFTSNFVDVTVNRVINNSGGGVVCVEY